MTLFPSACVWDFDRNLDETLKQVQETAFHYIDVEPHTLDVPGAMQVWKDLGLRVSCVALGHGLPRGVSLEANDEPGVRKGLDYLRQVLRKSADAGARCAYITSCMHPRNLPRFEAAVVQLAEAAALVGIKLCIEHMPGRALGTARRVSEFAERLNHPNVFVLLDIGHTLLSRERPSDAVAVTGKRLGYVQVNDNDGKKDRHWALLEGKLTLDELRATLSALQTVGYDATIGLELKRDFASWISGMAKNRNLLLRLQEPTEAKSFQEPEVRRKA